MSDAASLRMAGAGHFAAGRVAEAIASFQAALDATSAATAAGSTAPTLTHRAFVGACCLHLAACAAKLQQWAECEAHASAALAQEPGNATALKSRAEARRMRGDAAGARADVDAALAALGPADGPGSAPAMRASLRETAAALDAAVALRASHDAAVAAARVAFANGQLAAGAAACRNVFAADPSHHAALAVFNECSTVVETRPAPLGRVLVAARAFALHELVLAEAPLLVWRNTDGVHGAALAGYRALDPESATRVAIDAMAHHAPPDADERTRLLSICATNTHSYHAIDAQSANATVKAASNAAPPMSALFERASKAAHSCAPTVMATTKTGNGLLEYRAIVPIAKGDLITFPYVNYLNDRPTRRRELLATKNFLCECTRCSSGFDDTLAMVCPKCALPALLPGTEREEWRCARCGASEAPPAAALAALASANAGVAAIERAGQEGRISEGLQLATALRLGVLSGGMVGLSHNVVYSVVMAEATLCASVGLRSTQSGSEKAQSLLRSAFLSVAAARFMECRASGCFRAHSADWRTEGFDAHPPTEAAACTMFYAACDVREAKQQCPPQEAAGMRPLLPGYFRAIERYLPFLDSAYGPNNADLRGIRAMMAGA